MTLQGNSHLISSKFFSQLCGLIAAGFGVVALVGWLMGWTTLTSLRADFIPMAPNTALSFIVLGISLCTLITERKWGHKLSRIGATVIFVLSLIRITELNVNINLNVDRWIFQVPGGKLGLIPVGQMALPTSLNFLLASVALFLASSVKTRLSVDALTIVLAGLTTFIGVAFCLGYIYGAPLLYGGTTIPMALNTAIAFCVLGLGLVINKVSHDIAERKQAAEALRKAHDELEVRVAERTAGLAKASEALRAEIIERRRAEERLRLLGAAMESTANGIVITDRSGAILWVNPAFSSLTGYTAEEAIGQNVRILKSGKHDMAFYRRLWDIILSGKVWHGELINHRKDGSLYTEEMNITPVQNERGEITHFIAIKQDITERKRAEEAIRSLNDELEQRVVERTAQLAAVNKELEAFAYSVSHDLKAPLRGMEGFARALLEDYPDRLDETGRHYLDMIRGSARRMGELIDDLLRYSRVERRAMRWEPVGLERLVRDLVAERQAEITARGVRVEVVLPFQELAGEREGLQQALANLLDNALKFTQKVDHPTVTIRGEGRDAEWLLSVADNGVGFDPKYRQKAFAIFQRLHSQEEYEGTGIGLAIVKKVAERHGGRVWAESQPGKGATFYLAIPTREGGQRA